MIDFVTNHVKRNPVTDSSRLISHNAQVDPANQRVVEAVKARMRRGGNVPVATLKHQLALVDQLSRFEFGRFLLANRGLDAYWPIDL
jgi:hypothetical protein